MNQVRQTQLQDSGNGEKASIAKLFEQGLLPGLYFFFLGLLGRFNNINSSFSFSVFSFTYKI